MYFIFPPHITSASALHGETGNPEIASFHLNAACFFMKRHETQLNHPSLSKRSTGCTRQDLGREHSILLSVSKSQWTVLIGYLTISTNVRCWCYQTHHRWQFFSFRKTAHKCVVCVTQSNWVKMWS